MDSLLVYLTGLLVIGFFYLILIVPTQWLKVEYVRLPLGLGVKILQISDLHVEHIRVKPRVLQRLIARERPDYIFVTGDFTQKARYLNLVKPYADVLERSGVPVYIVPGNHDYKLPRIQSLLNMLERRRLHVLRNESVSLNRFELVGIDDYDSGHHYIAGAYRQVKEGKPIIVITHDPNIVLEFDRRFNYLMSGHLHGKQINIPFIFKLRPAGLLPAKGIYKGLHQSAFGPYYISKGISQTGLNVRFAVRSEVTIHEL